MIQPESTRDGRVDLEVAAGKSEVFTAFGAALDQSCDDLLNIQILFVMAVDVERRGDETEPSIHTG
jgi:hypothetical protein